MNSTAKKVFLIILASFAIEALIGFAAYKFYIDRDFVSSDTDPVQTVEGTVINDKTLILLFTHAGDDSEGNPVEKEIIIQGTIKHDDIPYYPDKAQYVIVTCGDPELLLQGKTALTSHGYTNIMET